MVNTGTMALCAIVAASIPGTAVAVTQDTFVKAAISIEDSSIVYDGKYVRLDYPMGDVSAKTGVCSDVIIRAYRLVGIDLQQLVHEDMSRAFNEYPKHWGLRTPDSNIDHRRVPNLAIFFTRHGTKLAITKKAQDYRPGDIVTWNLAPDGFLPHIGIVTNRKSRDGTRPLIMHNSGNGQIIEDLLFSHKITGHYRYGLTD